MGQQFFGVMGIVAGRSEPCRARLEVHLHVDRQRVAQFVGGNEVGADAVPGVKILAAGWSGEEHLAELYVACAGVVIDELSSRLNPVGVSLGLRASDQGEFGLDVQVCSEVGPHNFISVAAYGVMVALIEPDLGRSAGGAAKYPTKGPCR